MDNSEENMYIELWLKQVNDWYAVKTAFLGKNTQRGWN